MSFNFVIPEFNIGGAGTPPLQFFRRGFNLTSNGSTPSWQDIILSGNGSLTLTNAKANGLNYLKLFGGTEQTGTPTPDTPMDIVCNNGVLKYGNTSKNLVGTASKYIKLGEYTDASGNIVSSAVNFQTVSFPCKPNTTYTASISSSVQMLRICTYDASGVFVQRFNTQVGDGVKVITFTTGANVSQFNIGALISQSNVTQQMIDAITWQIEQGSTDTDYEPYNLEVYADGTTETVGITGKNLFDEVYENLGSSIVYKPLYLGVGTYTCSYSLPHMGSGTSMIYFLNGSVSSGASNKVNQVDEETPRKITTSTGYVTIAYRKGSSIGLDNKMPSDYNCMIEKGSSATTYEPYYNGGNATAEMLLKVGDYQDVQSILDGAVTRNVGIKVLDGTESWSVASTNVLQADVFPVSSVQPAVGGYCTALSYTDSSTLSGMPENSFRLGSQVYPRRMYVKSSTLATDATTWTNYLKDQYNAGTPVIVVYPLAESTTETVTGQPLSIQAGTNIVEITQASIDNLGLEVSYKGTV